MITGPSSHERLGFSGNWVHCAAAPRLQAGLPESNSKSADYGTECHAILEESVNAGIPPSTRFKEEGYNEYISEGGYFYTKADIEEMAEAAEEVFHYIQKRWVEMGIDATEVFAEHKMYIAATNRIDLGGTADVLIAKKYEFEVIDFKSSAGRMVHTTVPQLKLCALGFLEEMDDPQPGIVVHLTIAQPRYWGAAPIRTLSVTAQSLWDWRDGEMTELADATDRPDAPGTPTGEGCHHCEARLNGGCRDHDIAIAQALTGSPMVPIADITQQMITANQEKVLYNNTELSKILLLAPVIRNFCEDMESHAQEVIMNGEAVPLHKVVTTKGRAKWVGDMEELMTTFKKARSLKPDDYMTSKLRTPKQVGLIKTGAEHDKPLPKALLKAIQEHTGHGPDGLKLVLDTEPGESASPAFQPVTAEQQAAVNPQQAAAPEAEELPSFLQ